MVTTNIKVSRDAHALVMAAAGKLGVSMSDALIYLVTERYPDIYVELRDRQENQREVEERKRRIKQN